MTAERLTQMKKASRKYNANLNTDLHAFNNKLYTDGYTYYEVNIIKGRWYWKCRNIGECNVRAITYPEGDQVVVVKGPNQSPHQHPLNRERAEAEIVTVSIVFF